MPGEREPPVFAGGTLYIGGEPVDCGPVAIAYEGPSDGTGATVGSYTASVEFEITMSPASRRALARLERATRRAVERMAFLQWILTGFENCPSVVIEGVRYTYDPIAPDVALVTDAAWSTQARAGRRSAPWFGSVLGGDVHLVRGGRTSQRRRRWRALQAIARMPARGTAP